MFATSINERALVLHLLIPRRARKFVISSHPPKMRALLAIAALVCLLASARGTAVTESKAAKFESPIDVHVVYVMTFSVANRALNDGQSIKISAATLANEINAILHDKQPGHDEEQRRRQVIAPGDRGQQHRNDQDRQQRGTHVPILSFRLAG